MRRLAIITAFAMVLGAVSVAAALAVTPGTYTPTSDSFNSANAPGSSHLSSGTVQWVNLSESILVRLRPETAMAAIDGNPALAR